MSSLMHRISLARLIARNGMELPQRRTVWRVLFILFLAYVAFGGMMMVTTIRAANSLSDTGISSILSEGDDGLVKLNHKLERFYRRFSLLQAWSFPFRKAAYAVSFVPQFNDQRLAVEYLLDRVEIDYLAAQAALELGRSTLSLRDAANARNVSISDEGGLSELRISLSNIEDNSKKVLELLEEASEVQELLDGLAPNFLISTGGTRLTAQEQRLREIARFSVRLSQVLMSDLDLLGDVESTFRKLQEFSIGELSINETATLISDFAVRTNALSILATDMVENSPPGVVDSDYGDLVIWIRDLNVAIDDLVSGLDSILETTAFAFDAIAASEGPLLENGQAVSLAVNILIEKKSSLVDSTQRVAGGISSLIQISAEGPISIGSLGELLKQRVAPLIEVSRFLEGAPQVASHVFGTDGSTRRYLVLGQTSDELRAAGGFTSSAWVMTFEGGALIENRYIDVSRLEDPDSLASYPPATEELQIHMDAGVLYMRDVGWNPHFPSVGRLAVDMHELGEGFRVDGVLSLTQWALVDFAAALGGIQTEDGNIEASEILSVIQVGTDEQGTGYLGPIFESLVSSLSGDQTSLHAVDLLTTIIALFASKDMMLYSTDTDTQSAIVNIGWDGGISDSIQDRLVIVDSNVGWNKVDRNIDRDFAYEIDLTDPEQPSARLKLTYSNNSLVDDNRCDLQAPRFYSYEAFLQDCYWNYIRVYVPLGSRLTGGDTLPLASGSVAVRIGQFAIGRKTVSQHFDENGDYISGLLMVNPQSVEEVVFEYKLPSQVVKIDKGFIEYHLDIVIQGGTRGRSGTVVFNLPPGSEITEISPEASVLEENRVFVVVPRNENSDIQLKFRLPIN